jgi:2-polyprenyl-6-methoxyphenol hydroxylase-like FAD-dependent oxidoreductase
MRGAADRAVGPVAAPAPAAVARHADAATDADVLVVGGRCAGSAVAIELARAGRRVVVLDRAAFPSDTLSTHLLWPAGVAELRRLGALEAVLATGAPPLRRALAGAAGMEIEVGQPVVDGIDHGLCVRRPALDAALVDAARRAGAEVRERSTVTGLLRDGDRVAGVRVRDRDGHETALRAPLVIGADGRRSRVAQEVGALEPERERRSGRDCFFGYWRDAPVDPAWRSIAAQWRADGELGTAFPCDGGLVLVLLQPPVARRDAFAADREGAYRATIARLPALERRLAGAELVGKVRSATRLASYFRRSAGPGWALAGDAGHFKDPVTAQGIRDALHYGRRLGVAVAPVLDDPVALDAATARWERERERECLEVYQWTNALARGTALTPLEAEVYRAAAGDPSIAAAMLEVFARRRRPSRVLPPHRAAGLAARSLLRRGDRRAAVTSLGRDVATACGDALERVGARRG